MKFVHCADIHLDSPLRGLEAYEGAPVEAIRGATRRAFEKVVDLCLAGPSAFLIIAGDLYDGDWNDYNTGLFFVTQMARLRAAGIPAYLTLGNHDAASRITKRLQLPENVHQFPHKKPGTFRIPDLGVALHGQSFATQEATVDLAANYPPPVPGHLNIGVLHTSVDGREGHDPYAPCSLHALRNKGYDYWALGHVHKREVLHETTPPIVFPGNVQGRHVKETGAKGCTVVTVEDGGIRAVEHADCDVLRWDHLQVDASGSATSDHILARVRERLAAAQDASDGRPLAVRVTIHGRTAAHASIVAKAEQFREEVRAAAADVGVGDIWVEKVKLRIQPPGDLERIRARDDVLGELLRTLHDAPDDPEMLSELRTALEPLTSRLPAEARNTDEGIRLEDPDHWRPIFRDVEDILLARFQAEEPAR